VIGDASGVVRQHLEEALEDGVALVVGEVEVNVWQVIAERVHEARQTDAFLDRINVRDGEEVTYQRPRR
jgi:hypothetical protein